MARSLHFICIIQLIDHKHHSSLTSRHKYCILTYSTTLSHIVTEASGQVGLPTQPTTTTATSTSTQSVINPSLQYIAALLYPSTITLIVPAKTPPLMASNNTNSPAGNATIPSRKLSLRLHNNTSLSTRERKRLSSSSLAPPPQHYVHLSFPDKHIIAMTFLMHANAATTTTSKRMMVLYDDALGHRYLQEFSYDSTTQQTEAGAVVMDHIEQDATLLIAVPLGGVLLISGQCIRYLQSSSSPVAIGITSSMITSHAMISPDGSRFFLGNADGHVYLLVLNQTPYGVVHSLGFIELGNISIPSCLVYLGNDVLYVGSSKGDSQVVHVLGRDSIENNDILQVIETFPSLGPVIDFCMADLDKQGQPQLITCSGVGKDSSLRIIRSGVGLNQLAAIEMSGVKATWALRSRFADKHTGMLLISSFNATHLLRLEDSTIAPVASYAAILMNERTLMAGNVVDDMMIQVTDKSVRLMDAYGLVDEWRSSSCMITVAALNATQCVVSLGFGRLVALDIDRTMRRLVVIGETQLAQDVACIDITPTMMMAADVIAVGVWQQSGMVVLLRMDASMAVVAHESLGNIPRSILMARLENIRYLLVGLGDGQVYNFRLDGTGGYGLWDKKRSFLGKLPIVLGTFSSNDMTHVFAASDKPSVIHSRNQKLVYSNVNLKEVRHVTSFNSASFPDAVALTTRDGLVIGQMEEIQKLHITKIPIKDTPRRIIYQETSHTFGVITERLASDAYTLNSTTGGFEILDDQSFTVLDRIYFKQYERPLAAITLTFDQDENEYYVIATGRDSDAFETTSSGRILVLQVQQQQQQEHRTLGKRLSLVHQIRTQGGMVEQLRAFQGKLIASVRGNLEMYEWKRQSRHLELICSHQLASITESLATHGDYIMAGDMIASVTVLKYDGSKQPPVLEEVAADETVREVTSMEALSDTLTLGAERDGHLFVVERATPVTAATASLEDPLLETVSEWHLGELVQRFQFGTLGNNADHPDTKQHTSPTQPKSTSSSSSSSSTLIFATVNGAIGLVADLSEDRFKLLWHMQNNMTKVVKSVGDLSHADWRSVCTMDRKEESSHFIDGDLIESFLDLTPQQMQQVVDGHQYGGKKLDHSIEDLCKVVEELMSLHS
ncbi:unnamed protein product [Absidia cylindrospora]